MGGSSGPESVRAHCWGTTAETAVRAVFTFGAGGRGNPICCQVFGGVFFLIGSKLSPLTGSAAIRTIASSPAAEAWLKRS